MGGISLLSYLMVLFSAHKLIQSNHKEIEYFSEDLANLKKGAYKILAFACICELIAITWEVYNYTAVHLHVPWYTIFLVVVNSLLLIGQFVTLFLIFWTDCWLCRCQIELFRKEVGRSDAEPRINVDQLLDSYENKYSTNLKECQSRWRWVIMGILVVSLIEFIDTLRFLIVGGVAEFFSLNSKQKFVIFSGVPRIVATGVGIMALVYPIIFWINDYWTKTLDNKILEKWEPSERTYLIEYIKMRPLAFSLFGIILTPAMFASASTSLLGALLYEIKASLHY